MSRSAEPLAIAKHAVEPGQARASRDGQEAAGGNGGVLADAYCVRRGEGPKRTKANPCALPLETGAAHAGWVNQLLDDNPHLAGHRLRPLSLAYAAELDPDGERTHDGEAFVAPKGYGLTTTERIAAKYKPGKGYRSLTQIGNQLEALKTRHTRSGSKIVMPSDLQEWDVAVEVGACRPPRLVRGGAGTQPTPPPAERPHPEHAEPAPFDDAG